MMYHEVSKLCRIRVVGILIYGVCHRGQDVNDGYWISEKVGLSAPQAISNISGKVNRFRLEGGY